MLAILRPKRSINYVEDGAKDEDSAFAFSELFNGNSSDYGVDCTISSQLRIVSRKLYKALSSHIAPFSIDWENDSLEAILKRLIMLDFRIGEEKNVFAFNSFLLKRFFPSLSTDSYFSSRTPSSFSLLSMTFMVELVYNPMVLQLVSEAVLNGIHLYLSSILCDRFNFGKEIKHHLPIFRYMSALSIRSLFHFRGLGHHSIEAIISGILGLVA